MKNKIKLLKSSGSDKKTDFELVNEFFKVLQGKVPKAMHLTEKGIPKLSKLQSFYVIYYLQEHLCVFPDTIEQCSECGDLFDTYCSGYTSPIDGRNYCDGCEHLAPDEEDETE